MAQDDPATDKLKLTVLFNTKAEFDEEMAKEFLISMDQLIMDHVEKFNIPVELIQGMIELIPAEN